MPPNWDGFFIQEMPPLAMFEFRLEELTGLVNPSQDETNTGSNSTAEVCLIGLAAHFEAFCKNLFAAVINICPDLLAEFCEKRDVRIGLGELLKIKAALDYQLGSLLSEDYDFGSAKSINFLFFDLLGITLFSKDDQKEYGRFLSDRNLLVHHGGVYTVKYAGQRLQSKKINVEGRRIHVDYLIVLKSDFFGWSEFLARLARKMAGTVRRAALRKLGRMGITLNRERRDALYSLAATFKQLNDAMERAWDEIFSPKP